MKASRIAVIGAALIAIVLVSSVVTMSILSETRHEALISSLVEMQRDDGSFMCALDPTIDAIYNVSRPMTTAVAICSLGYLGILNRINSSSALSYLVDHQNATDLYMLYKLVKALKDAGAEERINRDWVEDFLMERYDNVSGGFHELPHWVNGILFTDVSFHLAFHPRVIEKFYLAYSEPNIISTYLALEIMNICDLEIVDEQKTEAFVQSCYVPDVGGFKPHLGTVIQDEPYDVDHYGCALAFTFAGIRSCRLLNVSMFNQGQITSASYRIGYADYYDRQKIVDYVSRCKEFYPVYDVEIFRSHPEDLLHTTDEYYNYYGVVALKNLGVANNETQKTVNYVLREQGKTGLWEGTGGSTMDVTWMSVETLAAVDIEVLDVPTPQTLMMQNQILTATIICLLAIIVAMGFVTVYMGHRQRKYESLLDRKQTRYTTSQFSTKWRKELSVWC